jgi:P-type Ca2+ transporter type 2C
MAFSGTIVTRGRGKAVVVSTGMKTEIGKIAKLIKETEKAATPIQKQTMDLSRKLGLFALLTSGLILVISLLRGFEFLRHSCSFWQQRSQPSLKGCPWSLR